MGADLVKHIYTASEAFHEIFLKSILLAKFCPQISVDIKV